MKNPQGPHTINVYTNVHTEPDRRWHHAHHVGDYRRKSINVPDHPNRALCSQNAGVLIITTVLISRMGGRVFPLLWRQLLVQVMEVGTIYTFTSCWPNQLAQCFVECSLLFFFSLSSLHSPTWPRQMVANPQPGSVGGFFLLKTFW